MRRVNAIDNMDLDPIVTGRYTAIVALADGDGRRDGTRHQPSDRLA